MSILSPADRAKLWHDTLTSGPEERGYQLQLLATEILVSVGRRLDLYSGYEDEIRETVALLDESGLLGRDDLRQAFEEADEDDEHARGFAALLADHLDLTADVARLGAERRVRAARLAAGWRKHILDKVDDQDWLTVAEVAARHGVTPQAVYKWIERGRIESERTPGGSIRVPAAQFATGRNLDRRALEELQARLLELAGDAQAISDEELADEVASRRRS